MVKTRETKNVPFTFFLLSSVRYCMCCLELLVMSLGVQVGEIPIHFSGSWQNKGNQHSLLSGDR